MEPKDIIMINGMRSGISTQRELAKRLGMSESKLSRRLSTIESLTVFELANITRVTKMTPEDRLEILKEMERRTK